METVWVRTPPRLQEESMDVAHPTQPKPSGGSTGGVKGKAHGFFVLQPSMLATPDLPTRRGRSTWGRAFPFLANREGPPCAPSPACGSRSIRGWDVPPRSRPCVVRTQGRVAHTTTHSKATTTPPCSNGGESTRTDPTRCGELGNQPRKLRPKREGGLEACDHHWRTQVLLGAIGREGNDPILCGIVTSELQG